MPISVEVPGRKIKLTELNSNQFTSISAALYELHDIMETFNPSNQVSLLDLISHSLDIYEEKLDAFRSDQHEEHLRWARNLVDRVKEKHLPKQQIHGDIWWENIFVDQYDRVGISDFDFTMIGPRSYDLAESFHPKE